LLTFTGDHVDILGRSSLNDLILKVAGGKGDTIEDTFFSNIHQYAEKVKISDDHEEPIPKRVLEKVEQKVIDTVAEKEGHTAEDEQTKEEQLSDE